MLRAVFMGTPEFAVPALEAAARVCEVRAVVTQPDRPRGRGQRMAPPAVKVRARELDLPVLQPEKVRDPLFLEQLRLLDPEVILVLAYARRIPSSILALPALGCINVHPSLLPRYRGASPIQAAIMNGDEVTGVCTFVMDEGYDTGDLLLCREVPIGPEETGEELAVRLSWVAAEVLVETVHGLEAGTLTRTPQPPAGDYTRRLSKQDRVIDWSLPAERVRNFVRALAHRPGAATTWKGQLLAVGRVALAGEASAEPGTVVAVRRGEGPVVATGAGAVVLLQVKPPGRDWMDAWSFLQGHPLGVGQRLGA